MARSSRIMASTSTRPAAAAARTCAQAAASAAAIASGAGATVGQLAALDLDVSKPENKIYLMKLTGKPYPSAAVNMAAPWKAKAIEALAFWQ